MHSQGRSTFYLSHDDGVKSSYDGVEYVCNTYGDNVVHSGPSL